MSASNGLVSPVGVWGLDKFSPRGRILMSSSLLPLNPAKYRSFSEKKNKQKTLRVKHDPLLGGDVQ